MVILTETVFRTFRVGDLYDVPALPILIFLSPAPFLSCLDICTCKLTCHNRDVIVGTGAPAWKNEDVWFCNNGVTAGKWLGMRRCQHPDIEKAQTHGMGIGDVDGDGREDLVYSTGGFPGFAQLVLMAIPSMPHGEIVQERLGDDRGGIILVEDVAGLGKSGVGLRVSE